MGLAHSDLVSRVEVSLKFQLQTWTGKVKRHLPVGSLAVRLILVQTLPIAC